MPLFPKLSCSGGWEPALRFSSSAHSLENHFGRLTRVLLGGGFGAGETRALSWRPISLGLLSPIISLFWVLWRQTGSSSNPSCCPIPLPPPWPCPPCLGVRAPSSWVRMTEITGLHLESEDRSAHTGCLLRSTELDDGPSCLPQCPAPSCECQEGVLSCLGESKVQEDAKGWVLAECEGQRGWEYLQCSVKSWHF